MGRNFTDEQVKDALGEKEREAERLLGDKNKTNETLVNAKKLLRKLKKVPVIGSLLDDITTMIELIGDYVGGRYKEVPFRAVVSAMAGVIYVISPVDLIPDIVPVIGFLDDSAVIALILTTGLNLELNKYRKWKAETARKDDLEKAREDYIKTILKEKERT